MSNTRPVTAAIKKQIASLQQARHRKEHRMFVLEGTRSVLDTAGCFGVEMIVATAAWLEDYGQRLPRTIMRNVLTARPDEMRQMSSMVTPQGVLAVCHMPAPPASLHIAPDELAIALDRIQDPGNLGTIMRVADWFGITRIIASPDTVDIYNPKVVQATMGAIARVQVIYTPLADALAEIAADGIPVYGTFLDGTPLPDTHLTTGGVIVMGNEGNGISPEVAATVTQRITIPSYPADRVTVESLNVSVAAAITIAAFRMPHH